MMPAAARRPLATYRLQVHHAFPLRDAAAIVPYLARLGISDVYSSPLLRARQGSNHGYNTIDPAAIDPQIGGEAGLEALAAALRRSGLDLLVDIVPNHMAACSENGWWMDVLEHGPSSPFAHFFDIDWDLLHENRSEPRKVLLPILGDGFGRVLERGELRVALAGGRLEVKYYDHRLPVAPASYAVVADTALEHAPKARPAAARALKRFAVRLRALSSSRRGRGAVAYRRALRLRDDFAALCSRDARLSTLVRKALQRINGRPGKPESFSAFQHLLDQQHYRLAWWRSAAHLINYRRFFDINDLVGMRVEQRDVFAATHGLLLSLVRRGIVSGLRIDHIDGLRDPEGYLRNLNRAIGGGRKPAYVVVEKILSADEKLPATWQTAGTTGYEFLNAVNGLFVDARGLHHLRRLYSALTNDRRGQAAVTYGLQKDIMAQLFVAPLRVLSNDLLRLAATDRHARDVSPADLRQALIEFTAGLPVYRTYVGPKGPTDADREHLRHALNSISRHCRAHETLAPAVDFLHRVVLLETPHAATRRQWLHFTRRWQQFTGAVAAKGVEDTAFYRFHPLVSLNAVGADPERLTAFVGIRRFHARMLERCRDTPATMNTTSTHDSKRSEDVRARINVLSELPQQWERSLLRWHRLNQAHRTVIDGAEVPDANEELFIYQNLLGVWPNDPKEVAGLQPRFEQFVIKANRESKLHTNWTDPNEAYETALRRFVAAILSRSPRNRFLPDFLRVQQRIAYYGAMNSLSQLLIKITAPGVPDLYQGNDLWDFSLVDPDNRRPVDYSLRARSLHELETALDAADRAAAPSPRTKLLRALCTNWSDGRIKLFVTREALRVRRAQRDLFERGEYIPLETSGARAENLIAFARRRGRGWTLTAAPRCLALLGGSTTRPLGNADWRDTGVVLPPSAPAHWTSCFDDRAIAANDERRGRMTISVGHLLNLFPLALLHNQQGV